MKNTKKSSLIEFSERIQLLIGKNNLRKIDLARKLGIRNTTVQSWFSGVAYPKIDTLIKLSELLKVSVNYILTGSEAPGPAFIGTPEFHLCTEDGLLKQFPQSESKENYVAIPLISGAAACGPGAILEDAIESFAIIYQSWCKHPKNFIAVRIMGDSMLPTLRDGDIVAIDKSQRDPRALERKLVAINHEDMAYIKRLIKTKNGIWIASSDNRMEPDDLEIIDESTQIIGKVAWFWGKFK